MRAKRIVFFLIGSLGLMAAPASGENLPEWEIGVGFGALHIPDYRGADESQDILHPYIMPIYRGEFLRADEEGIRGRLFDSERVKFDISLDGGVPVSSDDNNARRGMSDLGASFQIGPMLSIKLWGQPRNNKSLTLDLPVRGAFALDGGVEHIGYTAHPQINYRQTLNLLDKRWHLGVRGGPVWGTEDYHDYYYQVTSAEAIPGRAAYDAQGGYGGGRAVTSLYRRDKDMFFSAYAVFDWLDGAEFENSPLVREQTGLTAGFVVAWFPFQSEKLVKVPQSRW